MDVMIRPPAMSTLPVHICCRPQVLRSIPRLWIPFTDPKVPPLYSGLSSLILDSLLRYGFSSVILEDFSDPIALSLILLDIFLIGLVLDCIMDSVRQSAAFVMEGCPCFDSLIFSIFFFLPLRGGPRLPASRWRYGVARMVRLIS